MHTALKDNKVSACPFGNEALSCRPDASRAAFLGRVQRKRSAATASATARERKVTLLRKYRVGELPDVAQVAPASFLAPLGGATPSV